MMSDESLELFDAIAEASRCSMCEGYLSFTPISVITGGKKICGRCTSANPGVSTIRDTVLEDVLTLISFPCRFEGCHERLLFDQVIEHEIKCDERPISCFAPGCDWHESGRNVFEHITYTHKHLLSKKPEIKLQVQKSDEGMFIVAVGKFHFTIKYIYDANNNNLHYGIACYPTDNNVSFEMTLMNKSYSDRAIHLPAIQCQALTTVDFNNLQNKILLNLHQYYETLNNADSIVILIDFLLTPVCPIGQSLKLPECASCCNYLLPPLFKLNANIVCYKCGENNSAYLPLSNDQLSEIVKQIYFPCRWKNCTFVEKYDAFKTHLTSCKFYRHYCFFLNCPDKFTVFGAIDHYKSVHDAIYFPGPIFHAVIKFSKIFDLYRQHTMIGDDYFLFEHQMTAKENEDSEYIVTLKSTISGGKTVSVHLEHQHCRLQPKPFPLNCSNSLTIKLNELPSCFLKEDVLTVTINLK